jgi:hypothetical protein
VIGRSGKNMSGGRYTIEKIYCKKNRKTLILLNNLKTNKT